MVYKAGKVGHRSWCRICCVCSLNNSAKEGEKKKKKSTLQGIRVVLSLRFWVRQHLLFPFLPFPLASAFLYSVWLFCRSASRLPPPPPPPHRCLFFSRQSRHHNIVLCLLSFILTGSRLKSAHNVITSEEAAHFRAADQIWIQPICGGVLPPWCVAE